MPSASKLVCAAATAAAALTMGPAAVDAAGCNGHSTPGPPNLIPVDENPEYKLLKTTTNGKLYSVGTGDDALQVAHVWGSAYDMGYAQGELLTKEMQEFIPDVYSYLVEQVLGKAANNTLLAWAIKEGVDVALDLSYERTKDFIKPYVIDEMKGIAAATGVEVEMVRRLNWIPELTRGSCSMFGAWGNATATRDGELLQLRALDWDTDGPFKNYPVLVVYHGEEDPSFGNTFASLGFAGFTGTITGMSKNPLVRGVAWRGVAALQRADTVRREGARARACEFVLTCDCLLFVFVVAAVVVVVLLLPLPLRAATLFLSSALLRDQAVSEIGVSFPDNTFGPETYLAKGYPFSYLIRDILQYDNTVTDADNRITEAQKTCDLILGVGTFARACVIALLHVGVRALHST